MAHLSQFVASWDPAVVVVTFMHQERKVFTLAGHEEGSVAEEHSSNPDGENPSAGGAGDEPLQGNRQEGGGIFGGYKLHSVLDDSLLVDGQDLFQHRRVPAAHCLGQEDCQ